MTVPSGELVEGDTRLETGSLSDNGQAAVRGSALGGSTSILRRVRRPSKPSGSDCRLLLRATALVAGVRFALWILPFSAVRRLTLTRRRVSPKLARVSVNRLSWAVQVAGHLISGASCLTQALAMQRLMFRAGHQAELRIGVAKESERGFEAHAWVVHDGDIVLGKNADIHRYAPILTLSTEQS